MNFPEEKFEEAVRVVTKNERIKMPAKATSGSAGYDLHADIEAALTIQPGDLVKVPTGLSIALPSPGYVALLFARSGLAVNHGVALSNGVGVVDSDYRGEIMVGLCNLGKVPYTIKPQERIAQMVVMPVANLALVGAASLDATERNEGGFGSTGR